FKPIILYKVDLILIFYVIKSWDANQNVDGPNPSTAPREKDVAVCFCKDYSLGNPRGQFYSVL
ncbi:hypothetical protein NG726_37400, partial [Pseudomonas sp. MOB-449]|nr:hypothetical protein [Pseudomonas sp. MOB-449]